MLKRKKMVIGLVFLGTFLVGGLGFVACHRHPGFCGRGFHGKEFPKHVLEKMDSEVKELDLTEPQQETYQKIRARVEEELAEMARERKAVFAEVKREMDKDTPDLEVLADLLKSRVRRFPDRIDFFIGQFMEFYDVLDEEQKKKVTDHLKDKFKKFEACKAFLSSS